MSQSIQDFHESDLKKLKCINPDHGTGSRDRNTTIYESGTGGNEWLRSRCALRCVFARRASVRAIDGIDTA